MATLPDTYGRRQAPQDRSRFVGVSDVSATGQAMGRAAGQISQIGEQYQQQQDATAVSAARRALDDWERAAIFDPEKGAINKRGQDAAGVPDALREDFDKTAGKVFETLKTERQRRAFQEVADGRRGQVLDWASKHATKENETFLEGQYQADIKSFQDRAALFPDKAGAEIATMQGRTVGYLRGKGRSTEEINAAVRDSTDKAHVSVVASLLNSVDEASAIKYYDTNKAGMSADVQARIGAEIKERGNLMAAQRNADDLVSRGLTEKEALAETRKKFQGRQEEAAVQQLRTRFAEAETERIRQVKQVSNSAWSVLMEKGSMTAIPAQTMATLRSAAPEEERQMRDWLQSKAIQAKKLAEAKFEPDDQLYIGLRQMAREEPQRFLDLDLRRSAPKLSDGQTNALLSLQDGINRKDAHAMESNRVTQETLHSIDAQVKEAGLKKNAKPDSDAAKEYAKFQTSLSDALDQSNEMRKKKGQPPLSDQEAKAIGMTMLRQGIEQGSGIFGIGQTKKRGYEIATDPALAGKTFVTKTFGDIPQDVRDALTAELRQRQPGQGILGEGLTVAQKQAIERAYQKGIELGRFK